MPGGRFVLFSLARSGSTTLAHLLNCHPDVNCLIEPFNERRCGSKYRRYLTDGRSLDAALEEIWKTHNGFKHVWDPSGWPFETDPHLNERILLRPHQQTLFLTRRNILRRIVSSQISEQLGVWTETDEFRSKIQGFKFKPVDKNRVQSSLKAERRAVKRQRQLLADYRVNYLELAYEDLFAPATPRQQLDKLNDILAFLNKDRMTDERLLSQAAALFNPRNSKLNSHETYLLIPQIEEVEEQFGSDETGWLFK
jgi:hypothetical protein